MSEEKAPYNIGGQDPEIFLKLGNVKFIQDAQGRTRLEIGPIIRQDFTPEQKAALISFLTEPEQAWEATRPSGGDEGEEEGELEGAPATFLEIEEEG